MQRLILCTGLALAGCSPVATSTPPTTPAPGTRVTDPFRREHAELHVHLEHVDGMIASLATAPPDQRAAIAADVVAFFAEHIAPHARWEEQALYPAVDRRAATGGPFTASMRHEHTIVARRIDVLRAHAGDPDPTTFARQADQLLGLVLAHFEAEEEVLLPVLDRTMTPGEYERELGAGQHHEETP